KKPRTGYSARSLAGRRTAMGRPPARGFRARDTIRQEAAMDKMTPEQLKQKLDELLDEEYFTPVAVTRSGEPRIVVLPFVAYQAMRHAGRRVVRTEDMTEADIRA